MKPGSPKYHIVGGLHIYHVELCDNIVGVRDTGSEIGLGERVSFPSDPYR